MKRKRGEQAADTIGHVLMNSQACTGDVDSNVLLDACCHVRQRFSQQQEHQSSRIRKGNQDQVQQQQQQKSGEPALSIRTELASRGRLVGADGPLVEEKQSLRLSELGITGRHVILQAAFRGKFCTVHSVPSHTIVPDHDLPWDLMCIGSECWQPLAAACRRAIRHCRPCRSKGYSLFRWPCIPAGLCSLCLFDCLQSLKHSPSMTGWSLSQQQ
eukprot:jgi/Astpho2/190/fgenesh1_pg.00007_%23_1_t